MKFKTDAAKTRLRLVFIIGVALILICAIAIIIVLEFLVIQSKLMPEEDLLGSGMFWIIMLGTASIVIGLVLAYIIGRLVLKPTNKLIDGMEKLANGEFDTRIDLGKYDSFKELEASFNTLAMQLGNTEILRSDFVNNFSHEIKTPLASLSGLVFLMKNKNLSRDKQNSYLEIIEEEINRLSVMTTNMLNLSKVERQEILTDRVKINLSEQLRACILALEKKWIGKNLQLSLELDENEIFANEEMLRQVWINLIDNAIKFSDYGGELKISVTKEDEFVFVSIQNQGEQIPEEEQTKIFNKFYQSDSSHSKEGNGIGLSIVKSITELHSGSVDVKSQDGITAFTVKLPIE